MARLPTGHRIFMSCLTHSAQWDFRYSDLKANYFGRKEKVVFLSMLTKSVVLELYMFSNVSEWTCNFFQVLLE